MITKYVKLIFLLLITNCSLLIAQSPTLEWASRYQRPSNSGAFENFMALDKLGNVYVLGRIYNPATLTDIVLIKYNSSGDTLWTRIYNYTSNYEDEPYGLTVDSIGNSYITGRNRPNSGPGDIITLKYNPSGVLLWAKIYAGDGSSSEAGIAIALEKQNNFLYVCGTISTLNASVLIKYNTSGDSIWVRNKTQFGFRFFGECIALSNTGDIFIGGTRFNISLNEGDIMAMKYDTAGVEQWTSVYTNSGLDGSSGIAADNFGNAIVCGAINSGQNENYATIKYNSAGVQQWARIYNGTNNSIDHPFDIKTDKQNNILVTGYSSGMGSNVDYLTVKYNQNGDSIWVRRYNGPGNGNDEAYSLALDDSANVYITGRSIGSGTSWDYATIKYDSDGIQQWVERYNNNPPGNGEDIANKIVVDIQNNIFVTGTSKNASSLTDYLTIKYSQFVGIQPISNKIPTGFELFQNYPNPFNPYTKIRFNIYKKSHVILKVYNIEGKETGDLINSEMTAGEYEIDFAADNISSGVYFYKLTAGGYSSIKKMILIR